MSLAGLISTGARTYLKTRTKSQVIYNHFFDNLLLEILGEYVQLGIVVKQPNSTISETGFSHEQYSFRTGTNDVHLNEQYFSKIIREILED